MQQAAREENGLELLKVSETAMAMAMVQANYAAQPGHDNHNYQYDAGENLAWGTADWDPYDGWYTAEKETYDAAVKSGDYPDLAKLSAYDVFLKYPDLYQQVGHYLNIVSTDYVSTGMAYSGYSTGSYGNGASSQEFLNEWFLHSSTDTVFDASVYRAKVEAYVNQIKSAQSTYEDALKQVEAAKAALDKADTAHASARPHARQGHLLPAGHARRIRTHHAAARRRDPQGRRNADRVRAGEIRRRAGAGQPHHRRNRPPDQADRVRPGEIRRRAGADASHPSPGRARQGQHGRQAGRTGQDRRRHASRRADRREERPRQGPDRIRPGQERSRPGPAGQADRAGRTRPSPDRVRAGQEGKRQGRPTGQGPRNAKTDLAARTQALAAAQADLDAKTQAYDAARNEADKAKQAETDAETAVRNAQQALTAAQARLAKAKSDAKDTEAVKTAQAKVKEAQDAL